jgi:muramoyltetrapeptide carboxypeptidase
MIIPKPLQKGDKAAIIAPSGFISRQPVDTAITLLHNHGYETIKGRYVNEKFHKFAGTDEQRLEDLQQMLDSPSIKAIFCARGGYGLTRIWHHVDLTRFQQYPKWIIGYSDVTILHQLMLKKTNTVTIHGEMPLHFSSEEGTNNSSFNSIINILKGGYPCYTIPPDPLNLQGQTNGILIGGNLSVLYSLIGTQLEPDMQGKILFIEDTGEYLYHLDRMMMSLYHAGKLNKLKGLIVGGMTSMKETSGEFGKTAYEIIHDMAKQFNIPVLFGFPGGHQKENLALMHGQEVLLDVSSSDNRLEFLNP